MKKQLWVVILLLFGALLWGCSPKETDNKKIAVGVAFYPMKDILQLIEGEIKEEGYELVIHEFSDYQTPNALLKDHELDANMIQHDYFLQVFNRANQTDLVVVQPIYHATFALYAREYESLDELPEGVSITIADDSTNISRSLYLLGQAGLLTFKDNKTTYLTIDDIDTNPKNLQFNDRVPLTSLAQRYEETGLAIMYPTYAKSLQLEGDAERLYVEKPDEVTSQGYAISMVARQDNKESEKIKLLIKHLTTDKVRQFLLDNYSWASSPAF